MDKLTGGKFDGGIPPWPADEAFSVWVNAVRAALNAPPPGNLWLPTPAAFIDAITKTSDVYAKYKMLRDRAEFERWRMSMRIMTPPAKTPGELADGYINYVLNPEIEEALAKMPEGERAAALQKLDNWRKQLRHAILDFENVEVTPEKIADQLRRQKINEVLVQYFIDTVDRARRSGEKNLHEVIIRTQQDVYVRQDQMTDPRLGTRIEQSPFTLDYGNRFWIYANETGRLAPDQLAEMQSVNPSTVTLFEYLYGPGQPIKFRRDTYHLSRQPLQQGKVYIDDPKGQRCQ